MIRAGIFIVLLMSALATKAQSALSPVAPQRTTSAFGSFNQAADTGHIRNKWFITRYAGISTGFMAYKGGSSSFLSAPLAWQVNRQLTSNLYAFGNVSVTPYLLRANNVFYHPGFYKNAGLPGANNYGINPAAQVGVMYVNKDRTFSISGSIGVSSSRYNNYYSPFFEPGPFHTW